MQDSLFENLNNNHEKIKFTIETSPKKFLGTRRMVSIKLRFIAKPINSSYNGNCKLQKDTKEMQ